MGRRLNLPKTMTQTVSFVRWGLNICAEFVLILFVTFVALYRIQNLTMRFTEFMEIHGVYLLKNIPALIVAMFIKPKNT